MQGLGVMAKLWLLDFNYCQNNDPVEKSKKFSKVPGYSHWVVVICISLFLYLFIFGVNEFLVTTVNKSFS